MNAFVFPGQGSQFQGMGKDLIEQHQEATNIFAEADDILGFSLTEIMFTGSAEDLRQTRVTQPAIFVHSLAIRSVLGNDFLPKMVAGHSLGDFSALTATGALSFSDGLQLVAQRAQAMQDACNQSQGTMAAVLALADEVVEEVCLNTKGIVVKDNPETNIYPMPFYAKDKDEVFVGRIRKDESKSNAINLWIVSDNLRKGAATNTIQIAEYLVENKILR